MIRLAALALLLAPQDDAVKPLLQKLDDDAIEAREEAAAALIKLGKGVLPRLEEASRKASPELRERIVMVTRRIGELDRLAAILPAATPVTLRAEKRPLAEVLAELRKQSRSPFELPEKLPEGAVTIALDRVPYWKALDEVCRASGKIMYAPSPAGNGVTISAESFAERLPRHFAGPFAVFVQGLNVSQNTSLAVVEPYASTSVTVQVAWEKGVQPDRTRLRLTEIKDDQGVDLLDLGAVAEQMPRMQWQQLPEGAGQTLMVGMTPKAWARAAKALTRLRAEIEIEFSLQFARVAFPDPLAKAPADSRCSRFAARFVRLQRQEGAITAEVVVTPFASPAAEPFQPPLFRLKLKDGNEIQGMVHSVGGGQPSYTYGYYFQTDGKSEPVELFVKVPEVTHVERIELDLKDLSLR